jgi:hypothetical protein
MAGKGSEVGGMMDWHPTENAHCTNCGSKDLAIDGTAYFHGDEPSPEISQTFYEAPYCLECGSTEVTD